MTKNERAIFGPKVKKLIKKISVIKNHILLKNWFWGEKTRKTLSFEVLRTCY